MYLFAQQNEGVMSSVEDLLNNAENSADDVIKLNKDVVDTLKQVSATGTTKKEVNN